MSLCAVFITIVTSQYWETERSTAQHLYKHYSECGLMFSRASHVFILRSVNKVNRYAYELNNLSPSSSNVNSHLAIILAIL